MSIGPLLIIIVFVLLVATTVGTTFLWIVAAIAFLALLTLIIVMSRSHRFVGPRVLVDDVRTKLESYGHEDRPEPAVPVEVVPAEPQSPAYPRSTLPPEDHV